MSPPGRTATPGITGTRTKAETKRLLSAQIIRAMKSAGLTPYGWQVRHLLGALLAEHEQPTDEHLIEALMAAPWYPKAPKRRYKVGETGWRTTT